MAGLNNLEKAIEEERLNREEMMQQMIKDRQILENRISSILEQHAKERQNREDKLVKVSFVTSKCNNSKIGNRREVR